LNITEKLGGPFTVSAVPVLVPLWLCVPSSAMSSHEATDPLLPVVSHVAETSHGSPAQPLIERFPFDTAGPFQPTDVVTAPVVAMKVSGLAGPPRSTVSSQRLRTSVVPGFTRSTCWNRALAHAHDSSAVLTLPKASPSGASPVLHAHDAAIAATVSRVH
jgi:hypothetical protein